MEKVLTERNNSELNIVVHRHEKNGDNDLAKGDTQEIINSEIRQCDVIIFFAGNWIRSKTIGEFNVAIENASNKHIYFYQNPTLEYTQEDWTNTRACEAVCPKNESIANIARLNREFLKAKLAD
jgi:hypothetical protein